MDTAWSTAARALALSWGTKLSLGCAALSATMGIEGPIITE